ncbi:MAG: high-affinity branched-chain amino acid ABC transporter permease LivM [Burkholderiaceae bacterium]|nr:MAG: high-affinity branched-chain amino acid ABC transporter permease LivM [Burkholderiaceae bacterium]
MARATSPSPQATWRGDLTHALMAAVLTAVVMVPAFGLKLDRVGVNVIVQPHWLPVIGACVLVFLVQMVRPWIVRHVVRRIPWPTQRPAVSGRQRTLLLLLVAFAAVIWPFFSGRSAVDIATLAMIYIILGLGLNIVVGFAGLLDLGYVGFYAVGAYSYAMLFHWAGWTFWEALPVAGAMAAFFGFILGFPVLRLRGDYLAIVTLGFGEIIRLLLTNLTQWTGGPDGISGIPKPSVLGLELTRKAAHGGETFHQFFGLTYDSSHIIVALYLMALVLAAVTLWFSNRLIRMPVGRAWEALREDEIACRSLGLNPTTIKLSAFTMGAMFAGFGGALFAARQGIVNPESFTFIESALVLAVVVLGGMGSQLGVILAAILITVLPELAREFAGYRMLIFGLVMIVMMIWRPQGLLPMKRHQVEVP